MANKTFDVKPPIVRRLDKIGPDAVDTVIVYKMPKGGGPKTFYTQLDPHIPFKKKSLFDRETDMIAYAVTSDEHLAHEFLRFFQHVGGVHNFSIRFHVDYQISGPKEFTARLDRDPLWSLEQNLTSVLGREIRAEDWTRIREKPGELTANAWRNQEDKILEFAKQFGLSIHDIHMELTPSEGDLQDRKAQARAEIEKIEEQKRLEVDETRELGKAELREKTRQIERVTYARDTVTERIAVAVADQIGRMDSLSEITQATTELGADGSGLPLHERIAVSPRPANVLALPDGNNLSPELERLADFFTKTLNGIAQIPCGSDARKRLVGYALHAGIEVFLTDHGSKQEFSRFQEHFHEALNEEDVDLSGIDTQSDKFLKLVGDVDSLRRLLGVNKIQMTQT
jgi:hypothetical protein